MSRSVESNIMSLFAKVVESYPNHLALVEGNEVTTYYELDQESNEIANSLQENHKLDQSNGGIIALHMSKSKAYLSSMLAVLKLGYAFLPIDKNLPDARKTYLIDDSNARLILTDEAINLHIKQDVVMYEAIDKLNNNPIDNVIVSDNQLAYVIYTSGTTGNPKGVMIEHKGIVNVNKTWSEDFNIDKSDATVLFASTSFDASIWEIFMMLLNGGTIHVIEEEILKNVRVFQGYLKTNMISV